MSEPQKMYGWKEVAGIVGISVRQLREWVEDGRFPKPHKAGPLVRWFSDEITEWQAKLRLGVLEWPETPKKRPKGGKSAE